MSKLLFEADERTMENLMEGPLVTIEETQSGIARRVAFFNKSGFGKYVRLVDEYRCDGIQIAIEDIADNALQSHYRPDFRDIRQKQEIVEFGITGAGAFADDFDRAVFREFGNVRKIVTSHVPFGQDLPLLFPTVETWMNLHWKSNKVKLEGGQWPALSGLHIQGFTGAFSVFGQRPIRRLTLVNATITDIADLLQFAALEMVHIVSCRITGDVSALAGLRNLKSLRIEGKTKLEGWEKLSSETIENVEITHCPCRFPAENFPRLRNYGINACRPRDPFLATGGDWDELADAFAG